MSPQPLGPPSDPGRGRKRRLATPRPSMPLPDLPGNWKKRFLPIPRRFVPGGSGFTQSDSGLNWTGPGVAVLFQAESFEEDGSQLVLRDGDGLEVTRLDMEQLLHWTALGG